MEIRSELLIISLLAKIIKKDKGKINLNTLMESGSFFDFLKESNFNLNEKIYCLSKLGVTIPLKLYDFGSSLNSKKETDNFIDIRKEDKLSIDKICSFIFLDCDDDENSFKERIFEKYKDEKIDEEIKNNFINYEISFLLAYYGLDSFIYLNIPLKYRTFNVFCFKLHQIVNYYNYKENYIKWIKDAIVLFKEKEREYLYKPIIMHFGDYLSLLNKETKEEIIKKEIVYEVMKGSNETIKYFIFNKLPREFKTKKVKKILKTES